jgi:hypothetical protein
MRWRSKRTRTLSEFSVEWIEALKQEIPAPTVRLLSEQLEQLEPDHHAVVLYVPTTHHPLFGPPSGIFFTLRMCQPSVIRRTVCWCHVSATNTDALTRILRSQTTYDKLQLARKRPNAS